MGYSRFQVSILIKLLPFAAAGSGDIAPNAGAIEVFCRVFLEEEKNILRLQTASWQSSFKHPPRSHATKMTHDMSGSAVIVHPLVKGREK